MGTGTGIIPILLKPKQRRHFTGLEIQEECADMARRSVRYNIWKTFDIVCGDIKEAAAIFGAASFDVVIQQSAVYDRTAWTPESYMAKAIASHEVLCTLEDVVSQAANVLKIVEDFIWSTVHSVLPRFFRC